MVMLTYIKKNIITIKQRTCEYFYMLDHINLKSKGKNKRKF